MRAVLFVLAACGAFGQHVTSALAFDAASVKADTIGTNEGPGRGRETIEPTPVSLTMRNIRLRSAMKWAYHVQTDQISGPAWLDSERYLIIARTEAAVPDNQLRLMLQQLLTERFRMTLHREIRELAAFV
jgi:uncharacterized protein (TIGR03435 family)